MALIVYLTAGVDNNIPITALPYLMLRSSLSYLQGIYRPILQAFEIHGNIYRE
jgi:hypothetical protein